MLVEECCQDLLSHILPEIDRKRSGLAIDIGVGTFAFYCQLFDQLGFKTIAVEPLPTELLREICKYRRIKLIESCISDIDGVVKLYIGSHNKKENLNLNSMRRDWWGSSDKYREVDSMSLSSLLVKVDASIVTCLKIDVEGMESSIVKQLPSLPKALSPKVIMFEYGGGGTQEGKQGGWSKEILEGTMECLEIILELGYGQTIIVDAADETKEEVINLTSTTLEPTVIFRPESVYGNIIAMKDFQYPEEKIASICQYYRNNKSVPPLLRVRENIFKRIDRKIRYYVEKLKKVK